VGRKKQVYEEAWRSLADEPVCASDAELKTFVKAEKLDLDSKTDPVPRVIQPRTPRFNLSVGRYIKACEKMVYKAIDKVFGEVTVMKGLNADVRGRAIAKKWFSYDDPVAIGLDAKRFDQHVSEALLKFEHSVYNAIFRDAELRGLLRMQLRNVGRVLCADGAIKYVKRGTRASGDMNTSLGNVLLMCLAMRAYLRTKRCRASLVNDGDDCVLICERRDEGNFEDLGAWFEQLGMVMARETAVDEIEQIEFCQSHPVLTNEGTYRMVRDPRKVLTKDVLSVKPINNASDHQFYRRAMGMCGLSLAGDMPIFYEFYQMLLRGTTKRDMLNRKGQERLVPLETGMQYLAVGMKQKCEPPNALVRVSFAIAFDLMPDFQEALEEQYRAVEPSFSTYEETRKFDELIVGRI
jgi:hypothetical protein